MLTHQRLNQLLSYDPETGMFYWRDQPKTGKSSDGPRNRWAGRATGVIGVQGYRFISLDNEKFRACRLAWLYMTGEWPKNDIDHANGDPADDRWANLREATKSENMRNVKLRIDNASGTRGVSWCKRKNKWHARVSVHGRVYHCGYFADFALALLARDEKAAVIHGVFARFDALPLNTEARVV